MEMKVNIELIKSQREQRAWSQSQLAELCGLSLRTIQRIEKSGFASIESAKSIASVFEISVANLQVSQKKKLKSRSNWTAAVTAFFLIGLSSFFLLSANAETVMVDLKLSKQNELVSDIHVLNDTGSQSIVEVSDLFRFKLVTAFKNKNNIELRVDLFDISSGEEVLISSPTFITENRKEVEVRFGDYSLSLTPSK